MLMTIDIYYVLLLWEW